VSDNSRSASSSSSSSSGSTIGSGAKVHDEALETAIKTFLQRQPNKSASSRDVGRFLSATVLSEESSETANARLKRLHRSLTAFVNCRPKIFAVSQHGDTVPEFTIALLE
jgi:hypothetical protein